MPHGAGQLAALAFQKETNMDFKTFDFSQWIKPEDVVDNVEKAVTPALTFVPAPFGKSVTEITRAAFEATRQQIEVAGRFHEAVKSAMVATK